MRLNDVDTSSKLLTRAPPGFGAQQAKFLLRLKQVGSKLDEVMVLASKVSAIHPHTSASINDNKPKTHPILTRQVRAGCARCQLFGRSFLHCEGSPMARVSTLSLPMAPITELHSEVPATFFSTTKNRSYCQRLCSSFFSSSRSTSSSFRHTHTFFQHHIQFASSHITHIICRLRSAHSSTIPFKTRRTPPQHTFHTICRLRSPQSSRIHSAYLQTCRSLLCSSIQAAIPPSHTQSLIPTLLHHGS